MLATWRAQRLTEVLPFPRTRPIYVHTYFTRYPAAEYAVQKPNESLTRLSPPRVRVWPAGVR